MNIVHEEFTKGGRRSEGKVLLLARSRPPLGGSARFLVIAIAEERRSLMYHVIKEPRRKLKRLGKAIDLLSIKLGATNFSLSRDLDSIKIFLKGLNFTRFMGRVWEEVQPVFAVLACTAGKPEIEALRKMTTEQGRIQVTIYSRENYGGSLFSFCK